MRHSFQSVLMACLIILPFVCVKAETAPTTADKHAVLLMHMDGSSTDASHHAHRDQAKGNITWATGRSGQAMKMDGKSGVVLPNSGAFHFDNHSITIECWIKPDAKQDNIATLFSAGYGHGRMIDLRITNNNSIHFSCSASPYDRAAVDSGNVAATLFDGQWHHIAAVLDRSRNGELRIYLDQKNITRLSAGLSFPIANQDGQLTATVGAVAPWYIGKSGYRGLIDELHVSNTVRRAYQYKGNASPPATGKPTPERAEATLSPNDKTSRQSITISPANTVLVLPRFADSAEHQAAALIAKQIQGVFKTDKGFKRVNEMRAGDLNDKFVIAIGDTAWATDEDRQGIDTFGFRMRRKGNVLTLVGQNPKGTYYGAVRFLDEFCGVRFYMPGELFTSRPTNSKITIGKVDLLDAPYVKVCNSTGYHNLRDEGAWIKRNALDRYQTSHQHNMYSRFAPKRFAKKYPKIYPILDGKRYIPESSSDQRWQPTFSEPTLVDAGYESAVEFFTQNPKKMYIGFSVQDSHIHGEADMATPEVQKHGKVRGLSMLYWQFLNNLAARLEKTHPDKKIVGLVYASVRLAPPFKLHPNVIAWIQYKHSDIGIDKTFREPTSEDSHRMNVRKWSKIATTLGHHDWAQGNGFLIPRIYTHRLQTAFLEHDKLGAPLKYVHGEAYPNWGLDGPKLYMMAQIWWNPHVDVDQKLRQFCDDLFGPAASDMYAYFNTLETLYDNMNNDIERKLFRWWSQFEVTESQQAAVQQARAHLDKAQSRATTDLQKQRIELFAKTFTITEMLIELANGESYSPELAEKICNYGTEVLEPDPMTVYRASYRKQSMRKHFEAVVNRIKADYQKKSK